MNFCQFRTFLEPDVAYRIYKSNLFFFLCPSTEYLLQYSGLENSMDCIVHGVAKNRTQLSDFHSLTHSLKEEAESRYADICRWPTAEG